MKRLSQLAPTDLRGLLVAEDGISKWYPHPRVRGFEAAIPDANGKPDECKIDVIHLCSLQNAR